MELDQKHELEMAEAQKEIEKHKIEQEEKMKRFELEMKEKGDALQRRLDDAEQQRKELEGSPFLKIMHACAHTKFTPLHSPRARRFL